MSNAFKCDKCGELSEGRPNRYRVKEYLSTGFTGWTDSKTKASSELCDSCADTFEEMAREMLGEDDE